MWGELIYLETIEATGKDNEPETMIKCPYCGTENIEGQKLCKSCKRFLIPVEISRKPDKPLPSFNPSSVGIKDTWNKQRKSVNAGIGILGVCFLGIIIILGIVGISSLNDKINHPTTTETAPQISYSSSSSTSVPGGYIANSNSGKFHVASCKWVGEMSEEHKVYYSSREDAIKAGYVPCKVCNP
jgi:hypothetical protein